MAASDLFDEIIKTNDIFFTGIKIGDDIDETLQKKGKPARDKRLSNPYLRYFYEVGEMEEITIYYNFTESTNKVTQIRLYLISYPDFYWKKEGGKDYQGFSDLLQSNQIQPYSEVFLNTLNRIIAHFTNIFNKPPALENDSDPFNEPYQNYKSYSWSYEEKYRLSVTFYIDDSVDQNVKNTMIIYLGNL